MKKAEITEKLKGDLTISTLNPPHKIKFQVEFTEHSLNLKLLSIPKKNKIKDLIAHIFHPIYQEGQTYLINYALIKQISITDLSSLKLLIYNPISSTHFTLTFTSIETTGMIFNKKVSYENLHILTKKATILINNEIKHLIEQFLYLFTLLRDCLDQKKNENSAIEDILLKSYLIGKTYYEKYMSELKKINKLKSSVGKVLNEKIEAIKLNNSDIGEDADEFTKKIGTEVKIETFAQFDSLINEFKLRTSVYIEESIILFFKIVSVDLNLFHSGFRKVDKLSVSRNLRSVNERERRKNMTFQAQIVQNISSSNFNRSLNYQSRNKEGLITKALKANNNSFVNVQKTPPEILETPKFCDKKNKKNVKNSDKSTNCTINNTMSITEVMKHIDEGRQAHSFVPPTDTFNIFFNTTEIIHRKFFEIFFDEFIGKIFSYEKDKDGLIKLDSLYNYFVYLRGLKNILFIEKNRIYFSSVFFMDEEDEY